MPKNLYRPPNSRLTHGRGVWSGPFYPNPHASRDLNRFYAELRKTLDLKAFEKLCKNVHGYSESLQREITSDGYVNDLIVWVETDEHGVMGVLFPAADQHGKVTREIGFYVRGPGQADVDTMANALSSMFAARIAK